MRERSKVKKQAENQATPCAVHNNCPRCKTNRNKKLPILVFGKKCILILGKETFILIREWLSSISKIKSPHFAPGSYTNLEDGQHSQRYLHLK